MRLTIIAAALLVLFSAPELATAQALAPVAARASDVGAQRRPVWSVPARTVLGVGASVGGAFAGAFAGFVLASNTNCACEDPGLPQALVGAAIGSVAMAALASALPTWGSRCGTGERVGRALLGSAAGAVAGAWATRGAALGRGPFGYMAGAGIGGVLASGLC